MADEIIIETSTPEVIEVGVPGPQGPKGDKGDPGDIAGSLDWSNITGKPATFPPQSHTHVAADVTDFAAAVAAVSPPVDWNSLTGKPSTFTPSAHTHVAADVTDFNSAAASAAPVSSVAGRTGAVTLAVADVSGAVADTDARLSDARTPTAHTHGNLSDDGKIGSTAGLMVVTGANGIITTGSVPNEQVTSYYGNNHIGEDIAYLDGIVSGLGTAATSDSTAFSAASHTHGNLTNAGAIGTTANLPLKTGTNGVIEAGSFGTAAGSFAAGDDVRFSDARTPTAHKASHATGGTDALAPSDIGAQSIFSVELLVITTTAQVNLTAARAKIFDIVQYAGQQVDVKLPSTNAMEGDVFVFRWGTGSDSIRIIQSSSGSPITTISSGEQKRLIRGSTDSWSVIPVDTHTHAASQITSGTLAHERGGLEADVSAYSGLLKISGGATSAVTVSATGESVIGAADAAAARSAISAAAASHTHELTALAATGATNGHVLTANGSGGVTFAAAAAGGVSGVDSTTADVFSVSGSNLVADDGGLINSANPAVVWNDVSGKLVYANPLERPIGAGSMFVGIAPTTTALGTDAINIQSARNAATQVASTADSIAIGNRSTSSSALGEGIAIGYSSTASGSYSTAVGGRATATNTYACSFGHDADATANTSIAIGDRALASNTGSICVGGGTSTATGSYSIVLGTDSDATGERSIQLGAFLTNSSAWAVGLNAAPSVRAQFATVPFSAVYWGGQTTNNTATILNLDATATNRFTIAANTALAVDILLVARRSDVADKWLVARRFLGIRRNGSNGTSLIGTVQNFGLTDQTEGSPTWTFALTADDTNEALQLEVTGATGETVQWRACAIYRVV